MSATLVSVNVGRPQVRDWAGIGRTSIEKHPVSGPVAARTLGLDGDQVSDTKHHGGVDQAVYAFAREDLDRWVEWLGMPIRDGQFGENLTTSGIDVNEAEVGERWRIGSALLEVASVRIPCNDFKNWMGLSGYDDTAWVKRFTAEGRPGPYLRVVEEGVRRRPATRSTSCTGRGTASRSARCSPRSPPGASCCRSCCGSTGWWPRRVNRPRSTSREPDRARTVPPPGRSATGA